LPVTAIGLSSNKIIPPANNIQYIKLSTSLSSRVNTKTHPLKIKRLFEAPAKGLMNVRAFIFYAMKLLYGWGWRYCNTKPAQDNRRAIKANGTDEYVILTQRLPVCRAYLFPVAHKLCRICAGDSWPYRQKIGLIKPSAG